MTDRSIAISSVRWTFLATVVRMVVNFGQIAILARLLPPEVFGAQAIAMGVIAIATTFADFGFGNALFYYREASRAQLSSIYWVTVLIGLVCTLGLLFLSGTIGEFFDAPMLSELLMILSLSFLITASCQQLRIEAEKNFRFKSVALVEILSSSSGLCVAILIGLTPYGFAAITAGYMTSISVFALCAWAWLSRGWRPIFAVDLKGIAEFLRLGFAMLCVNVSNIIAYQADALIAGRQVASTQMGFYAQPRDLVLKLAMAINPVITRVGLPMIAGNRHNKELVARIYERTTLLSAAINFPLFTFVALFAPEIVAIYLGPNWAPSAPFLRGAALWAIFRSILNPIGSLLIGTGLARHALVSSALVALGVIATSLLSLIYLPFQALPYMLAAFYAAILVPFWAFNVRPASGLGFRRYHLQLLLPGVCTALAAAVAWFGAAFLGDPLLRLIAGSVIGAASYGATTMLLNRTAARTLLDAIRPRV